MGDGSNMGITAGRALGTILGGDGQPTEEEKQTPEQVRYRVMTAPYPTNDPQFKKLQLNYEDDGYSIAADCITKAFLLVEEQFPGTLEEKVYYTRDNCEVESLWGTAASPESAVWRKAMELWPDLDDQIGGASGFMVGFAYNTARWLNDMQIVGNPAIITIALPEDDAH